MNKNQLTGITAKGEDTTNQSNQVNQPGNASTNQVEQSNLITDKEVINDMIKSFVSIGINRAMDSYLRLYKAERGAL